MEIEYIIEDLKKCFNLKNFLTYGKILIEFDNKGATVTDCDETEYIEVEDGISSREQIQALIKVVNIMKFMIEWDNSKHNEYRLGVGLDISNSEDEMKLFGKKFGKKLMEELWAAGYNIIIE